MLAAMGYREGQGIGKTVIGRATPVDVNLKAGRTGLGIDEAKRRRADVAYRERQDRGVAAFTGTAFAPNCGGSPLRLHPDPPSNQSFLRTSANT